MKTMEEVWASWDACDDTEVTTAWQCPTCSNVAYLFPMNFDECGIPFCADCDMVMQYVNTLVKP